MERAHAPQGYVRVISDGTLKFSLSLRGCLHEMCNFRNIGVIQLRNNLIFIIDNLQYYLQVDVMESQYTIMEANMKNTRNFEDIQKAHSVFLANVMSQTFLLESGTGKKNSVGLIEIHKVQSYLKQLAIIYRTKFNR